MATRNSKPKPAPANRLEPDPTADPPDAMNASDLLVPLDYMTTGAVESADFQLRSVARPNRDKFFRVRPFTTNPPVNCAPVFLFTLSDGDGGDKTTYIVPNTSAAWRPLHAEERLRVTVIVLCQYKGGTRFLWELPQPYGNKLADRWANSRMEVAKIGTEQWVRPKTDKGEGCYHPQYPQNPELYDEPVWQDREFMSMVNEAYEGRIIRDLEHVAIREFLGS